MNWGSMKRLLPFGMIIALLSLSSFFSGCASKKVHKPYKTKYTSKARQKSTMRCYTVRGKRYSPTYVKVGQVMKGVSSWYGPNFHGKKTSNGEVYNMHAHARAILSQNCLQRKLLSFVLKEGVTQRLEILNSRPLEVTTKHSGVCGRAKLKGKNVGWLTTWQGFCTLKIPSLGLLNQDTLGLLFHVLYIVVCDTMLSPSCTVWCPAATQGLVLLSV